MKFRNIKPNEVLSTSMYLTVLKKTVDGIEVKDNFNRPFTVKGPKLIEQTMNSAAQYDTEEKVSRTKLAEVLVNAGDAAFTVVYDKQDGTERILVGKLLDTENHMGRSNAIDLEVTSGPPQRQIDHRTLKSLVLRGTKYVAK